MSFIYSWDEAAILPENFWIGMVWALLVRAKCRDGLFVQKFTHIFQNKADTV
jgi:hypothetical protein